MSLRIEATRLFLRPLEEADCSERYVAWLNDPGVSRYLETRRSHQTLDAVRKFVADMNEHPGQHLFGIFLKDGHRHVGNIKVGPIDPYHRCGDVSLFIGDKASWGRGIAMEAILAVSRYAFDQLPVDKLNANMYADNLGSAKAFEKAGYQLEGVRRAQYILDGKRSDIVMMGLLR